MAEYFTYTKKRKEYGKPCVFSDTEVQHCGYFHMNAQKQDYAERNPNFIQLDNILELSEHSVNTERVKTGDKGMYHNEGGWPLNVDHSEAQETAKFRKKIEKDGAFPPAVKELTGGVQKCIQQNNQIDLFEEYFQGETSEHQVENLSSKTLLLFKDNCKGSKRSISQISWHPEGPQKLCASYAIMRFQQMPEKMETQSYVWDLNNPNSPDATLQAQSPITSIQYNHKQIDLIGGGSYNGLISIWDLRDGKKSAGAIQTSPVEQSHYEPVSQFYWTHSRSGTEFVTTSTDGLVMWWDQKKFDKPVETLQIIENSAESNEVIGGTCFEYNAEAGPSKLLIGTEMGSILTCNKKPKKNVEITTKYGLEQGRHLGPVYSINRSTPTPKYFLSVGDWSAKVWVEDLKSPIIRTKYHGSYLTDGCFSPTRNGAFFLIRRDGWMDVWDYFYRQNEIAFSHKVSDQALTSIQLNKQGGAYNTGRLAAIGDQDGTVTILELCDSLYTPQPREKDHIGEMFEREFRKEKNLEGIKKTQDLLKKKVHAENTQMKEKFEKKKKEAIDGVEAAFSKMLDEYEKEKVEKNMDELDSPSKKKPEEKPKEVEQAKQEPVQEEKKEEPKQEEEPKKEETQEPEKKEEQTEVKQEGEEKKEE